MRLILKHKTRYGNNACILQMVIYQNHYTDGKIYKYLNKLMTVNANKITRLSELENIGLILLI